MTTYTELEAQLGRELRTLTFNGKQVTQYPNVIARAVIQALNNEGYLTNLDMVDPS